MTAVNITSDIYSALACQRLRERLAASCGGTPEPHGKSGVGATAIITIPRERTP